MNSSNSGGSQKSSLSRRIKRVSITFLNVLIMNGIKNLDTVEGGIDGVVNVSQG